MAKVWLIYETVRVAPNRTFYMRNITAEHEQSECHSEITAEGVGRRR